MTQIDVLDADNVNLERLFQSLGLRHLGRKIKIKSSLKHYILFVASIVFFLLYVYAAFISKALPDSYTDNWILDAIRRDSYICYLIPLMILPTFMVIYLNWLAMKFFESN